MFRRQDPTSVVHAPLAHGSMPRLLLRKRERFLQTTSSLGETVVCLVECHNDEAGLPRYQE
jgi:hypothetical protein